MRTKGSDSPDILIEGMELVLGGKVILSGFDLQVEKGEKVALIGDSGSGKSSLLQVILGMLPFEKGRVEVFGKAPNARNIWEIRKNTGFLPQVYDLKMGSVRELMVFPFSFAVNRQAKPSDEDLVKALKDVGLNGEMLDQPLEELSGGEKQRVLSTSVLLTQKPLYLLDEPTSSLDPTSTHKVISGFCGTGSTILVVAHDQEWKEKVDRVIEIPKVSGG